MFVICFLSSLYVCENVGIESYSDEGSSDSRLSRNSPRVMVFVGSSDDNYAYSPKKVEVDTRYVPYGTACVEDHKFLVIVE